MSNPKRQREHLDLVVDEFKRNGVRQWRTRRTKRDHTLIEFEYGGRWHTLTISGSHHWKSTRDTRTLLRRAFRTNSHAASTGQVAPTEINARMDQVS